MEGQGSYWGCPLLGGAVPHGQAVRQGLRVYVRLMEAAGHTAGGGSAASDETRLSEGDLTVSLSFLLEPVKMQGCQTLLGDSFVQVN